MRCDAGEEGRRAMKSFKELVREPRFAIMLAFAFLLAGWDLAYGSGVLGAVMVILLMAAIAANVWKTKSGRNPSS
ncbi:MAG: hypothetical protein JW834_04430 [Candidatus Diapherotrites archaeon]|nr:hypothetical protein [Candidatus Diapherotrites archaeon]